MSSALAVAKELAGQADKLNEAVCARAAEGTATILHGARDRKHNNAAVLVELPERSLTARTASDL